MNTRTFKLERSWYAPRPYSEIEGYRDLETVTFPSGSVIFEITEGTVIRFGHYDAVEVTKPKPAPAKPAPEPEPETGGLPMSFWAEPPPPPPPSNSAMIRNPQGAWFLVGLMIDRYKPKDPPSLTCLCLSSKGARKVLALVGVDAPPILPHEYLEDARLIALHAKSNVFSHGIHRADSDWKKAAWQKAADTLERAYHWSHEQKLNMLHSVTEKLTVGQCEPERTAHYARIYRDPLELLQTAFGKATNHIPLPLHIRVRTAKVADTLIQIEDNSTWAKDRRVQPKVENGLGYAGWGRRGANGSFERFHHFVFIDPEIHVLRWHRNPNKPEETTYGAYDDGGDDPMEALIKSRDGRWFHLYPEGNSKTHYYGTNVPKPALHLNEIDEATAQTFLEPLGMAQTPIVAEKLAQAFWAGESYEGSPSFLRGAALAFQAAGRGLYSPEPGLSTYYMTKAACLAMELNPPAQGSNQVAQG